MKPPYHDIPTYGPEGYVVNQAAVGAKTLDHVLAPEEALFIPKGGLHLVTALPDEDSLHLAVSVKPLGYHRYMAQLLDPELELDHPGWIGLDFDGHVQRMAAGAREIGLQATGGDLARRARLAVWTIIYEAYANCPYPPRAAGLRASDAARYRRTPGRPFAAIRSPHHISLEVLDLEPGPVGNYGFTPACVELPVEAESFVQVLERGAFDVGDLLAHYDQSTTSQLVNLAVELDLLSPD